MRTHIYAFQIITISLFILVSQSRADFNEYTRMGAAQIMSIIPTDTRTVIDLSGPWQRIIDGETQGTVNIPASETSRQPFVIRKSVRIESAALHSKEWQLQFLGASEEVELRINGRFVMRYPGSMVPFIARVPDKSLVPGSNTIELLVTPASELTNLINTFSPSAEQIHMGVLREVFLIGTPHVWAQDIKSSVTLSNRNSSGSVTGFVTVVGGNVVRLARESTSEDAMRQTTVEIGVEVLLIRNSDGSVVARSNVMSISIERARQQNVPYSLYVPNPSLWTPGNPNLYTLRIKLTRSGSLLDETFTSIGFRTLRVASVENGRKIFLNDSAIFINGVEYIEDYPILGPSMSFRHMELDVSLMKTLGVNVVKFRHGSPHPYMLQLCDMYGIMVMAELPAAGIPKGLLLEQDIVARMKNASERLITFLNSHPSVIAIGVADMLQEGAEQTTAFYADLVKIFRSRTSALIYKTVSANNLDVTSEGGFDILLIRIPNIADREETNAMMAEAARVIRTAAIVPSFGALVSPNNMNGFSDPLSNEAQAVTIRDAYQSSVTSGMAGAMVWSFNDYSLELPTMLVKHDDPYVCTSGLVDVWRQQRVSFAMYKSLINDEKEPLLQAREYNADTPLIFIVTGLVLALILAFLLNRSRRFREYFLRALIRPYNFYADIRDQRILSSIQTTLLGLVIASCSGLVLASLFYYLRSSIEMEYLMHVLIPSKSWYEAIRFVAWKPTFAVVAMSSLMMLIFFSLSVIFRIAATFVRTRIFFRDTFTIVIWSALPLVVLLPLGVALYQVLNADAMTVWIPFFILVIGVWSLFRVFRATSVVFDVSALKVYTVGAICIIVLVSAIAVVFMAQYNGLDFLQYYQTVVAS
ncbi:MAG: YIP1 family protein [Ignavibacteria bacterium]|nr:YIP1 family protein [Ignavibacteria bacterium]